MQLSQTRILSFHKKFFKNQSHIKFTGPGAAPVSSTAVNEHNVEYFYLVVILSDEQSI